LIQQAMNPQLTQRVGIFVFDEMEVLDFAGPFEVFTTATRVHALTRRAGPAPFSVFTVGQSLAPVKARAGLKVTPSQSFATHPPIDLLIIPGGVVSVAMADPAVIDWIAANAPASRITASVCTGAFLLAEAGLLDGKAATTHWQDRAELQAQFPTLTVEHGVRWVDSGQIVTSAGISAGIDMSLHLVERLADRALAEATARQMEFEWTEND
jgi:transcriptional regulator GlxA family with amidase domain